MIKDIKFEHLPQTDTMMYVRDKQNMIKYKI